MTRVSSSESEGDYFWLFTSNVLGVFATGIATVALALLAFHLADDDAGLVLANVLSLKMAVNILVPPLATTYATYIPRRSWLIFLNFARAGVLCLLPLVSQVYQVYLLVVVFEASAAAFRAAYFAIVPDLIPDDWEYAGAVAKARIAYNAESMVSPLLAAVLLLFIDFRGIFIAAVIVFVLAAATLMNVTIPDASPVRGGILRRMALKFRKLLTFPTFRGAFAINAAAVIIGAMVAVNTVVLVRGVFELDDRMAALALAAFGGGGIAGSLLSPRLIMTYGERNIMMRAGTAMAVLLAAGALLQNYASLLMLWFAMGCASTLCQLPVETILRRLSESKDRTVVYAAHYCVGSTLLLIGYQAAGWMGATAGMSAAFIWLGLLSGIMVVLSASLWPVEQDSR